MAAKPDLTAIPGLCLCFLTFFIACSNCLNSLPCIEVKRAYTEKGGNENEVPIQAISGKHVFLFSYLFRVLFQHHCTFWLHTCILFK